MSATDELRRWRMEPKTCGSCKDAHSSGFIYMEGKAARMVICKHEGKLRNAETPACELWPGVVEQLKFVVNRSQSEQHGAA